MSNSRPVSIQLCESGDTTLGGQITNVHRHIDVIRLDSM